MRQMWQVFRFEFGIYLKNKIFLGLTIFFIVAIAGLLTVPNILSKIDQGGTGGGDPAPLPVLIVSGDDSAVPFLNDSLSHVFSVASALGKTQEQLEEFVRSGQGYAVILQPDGLSFKYLVPNITLYDSSQPQIAQALLDRYQRQAILQSSDLSEEEIDDIMNAVVVPETINLGTDQTMNFLYTYILIMLLYMAILLYGQLVAQNVAAEKSSRAMELLVTASRPDSLIFGKVLAAGSAGFAQMFSLLLSAFLFYNINISYWQGNMFVASLFGMPFSIMLYIILFFVLGFFMYGFLYAALASFANRSEDVNTLSMPVTFLFLAVFFIIMFSLNSGTVDSTLMKICSYIPLSSPMAMFTRIAMGSVPPLGIAISVVLLAASTVGVGYVSAGLYRMGVLLYGKPPRFSEILKLTTRLREQRERR